jgi:succinate dehydrogenase / fumarate reductase flavoprotein subunit
MGGLYTTYQPKDDYKGMVEGAPSNMMTNVPGLYAFGEVNYQYHGATRLGANALLNCIFDGLFCGSSVTSYVKNEVETRATDTGQSVFQRIIDQENKKMRQLVEAEGQHNPYDIHRQLGEVMNDTCTVIRKGEQMEQARQTVRELHEKYKDMRLSDSGMWTNQNLSFARALGDMLIYAEAILDGSIARTESRGSHYRPDYPDRDDANWLKTTIAKFDPETQTTNLEYEDVPTPLVTPRERTYGKTDDSKSGSNKTKEAAGAGKQ